MGEVNHILARPTKVILAVGGVMAFVFALLLGYMAMDHNPQEVFSSDRLYFSTYVLVATIVWVVVPFTCLAGLVEWVIRFRRRRQ